MNLQLHEVVKQMQFLYQLIILWGIWVFDIILGVILEQVYYSLLNKLLWIEFEIWNSFEKMVVVFGVSHEYNRNKFIWTLIENKWPHHLPEKHFLVHVINTIISQYFGSDKIFLWLFI